jgi:hypothetical protein
MKKILKLSLVIAVLFGSLSTYAIDGNGEFNLHVLKEEGKIITIALNRVREANLAIYDQEGTLIYYENATGRDGILRTFNLKQFPEGKYFIEVDGNNKKVVHEIVVSAEGSTVSRNAVATYYKSNVTMKSTAVAAR